MASMFQQYLQCSNGFELVKIELLNNYVESQCSLNQLNELKGRILHKK